MGTTLTVFHLALLKMKMDFFGLSHITNLFLSLDPKTGAAMQYAASNPSKSDNLTTLPYVNV